MVRKIAIISALTASALFAATEVDSKIFNSLPFAKQVKIQKAVDLGSLYQIKGIYQSQRGSQPVNIFVSKDKKYFIFGRGFDAQKNTELTISIPLDQYKKDAAFSVGKGKDEYYVFTDPECPFCKRFEKVVPYLEEYATFHFFFFPLSFHPHAESMSRYILSLPKEKRADALYQMQVKNDESYKKAKYSDEERSKIDKLLAKQKEIANTLGVRGTPTVYYAQGKPVNWTTLGSK